MLPLGTIHTSSGTYRVVRRVDASASERREAIPEHEAERVLGRWLAEGGAPIDGLLSELDDRVFDGPPDSDEPAAAAERALEGAARLTGLILLRQRHERPAPGPRVEIDAAREAEARPASERKKDTEWIEVQLVDEEDRPVPGVLYEIKLSDGRVRTGRTDDSGLLRYEGLPGGECELSFVELDRRAWEPA